MPWPMLMIRWRSIFRCWLTSSMSPPGISRANVQVTAVPGLQRREPAVPDDQGGYVDVEDHGQLEAEGVHLNAVDQQLDGGIVSRGDPVRTELDNVLSAGYLPGFPGRLDQPFTRALAVDEQVA